jgi:hypothetical protein
MLPFPIRIWPCRYHDPYTPEGAVAYDEPYVLRLCAEYRLPVQGPIRYGTWCGREHGQPGQDILLAVRQPGALRRRPRWTSAAVRVRRWLDLMGRAPGSLSDAAKQRRELEAKHPDFRPGPVGRLLRKVMRV